jgi:predicted GNAT family acetyltransferase
MNLINNREQERYELYDGAHFAILEYIQNSAKIISLTHAEVPYQLRRKGMGGKLAEAVFQDVEKKGIKIIPICPFIVRYIDEHKEWQRIVASE